MEDCVVIGVPDDRFGQRVVLLASMPKESTPKATRADDTRADEVIAHVKTRIADYKAPRQVLFVDSIYRSPSGKADYRWAHDIAAQALQLAEPNPSRKG